MRVYPRGRKWAVTDDFGQVIAEFDTEERALQEVDWMQSRPEREVRQRHPNVNAPPPPLPDVPEGKSWFVVRRRGRGWEVEEHRVAPKVLGTETLSSHDDVRHHQCATEGELVRLRRSLADNGLFDRGIAR